MNKMKDLSFMTRTAWTLTSAKRVAGAKRVAAVLLAVMLTMTAQTAWAQDEGASAENGVYISKTFKNQDGSAVSSSDADTEFNFKMDEVDASNFLVNNGDGTYHKTASGKPGDEIAFPSFGIKNTDFRTKSNGEIYGDQRIYRYYVIEEVPGDDETINYDSQKIYVKIEAHGYNNVEIEIKIWASTDHQNWSIEVDEHGNVGTFNNTKKQFMNVEVEKKWQKAVYNGDQATYMDTNGSHTNDGVEVKLIAVKTLLPQGQGEEPQTGEQPGQQGNDEPVPVTPSPAPARAEAIGSIQEGLKSVADIIGNNAYTVEDTQTLNSANNWKYTWENLPKHLYDTDESIYTLTYYVVETAAVGAASNSYSDNGTEKVTISNYEEETSATVSKVWSDNNNQDGIRPASLTVDLMNGSTKVATVTLNDANNWTATVEHLSKYNNGQQITYTWSEKNLPDGYALTNTSESGTTTTLTNSRTSGGAGVTWEVTDTNNDGTFETLTINGNGAMADYDKNVDQPWYPFASHIKTVVIGNGITGIGKKAFNGCTSVTDVYCYADPTQLTWGYGSDDFKSGTPKTQCHVFVASAWSTKFGSTVNVDFVGDLGTDVPVVLTEGDGVDLLTSLAAQKNSRTDIPDNLNVTFSRTFDANTNGEGKASTVCLPYAVNKPDASVGTFYTFGGVTESSGVYTVTMNEMTGTSTTAGTPYLFKPAGGSAVPFSGSITIAVSYEEGKKPDTNGWEFRGTLEKLTWASGQTRLYGFAAADFEKSDGTLLNDVGAFRRFDWGYCDAFRCYLWAPDPTLARGVNEAGNALPESMRVILVAADGTTTDIGTLSIDNGEWIIDNYYDLNGRRLSAKPTKKGLYIHNGRKVLVP